MISHAAILRKGGLIFLALLANPEVFTEIIIDIDLFISDWIGEERLSMIRKINAVSEMAGIRMGPVFYRRSSRDNVHVLIQFPDGPISVLDAFAIRAYLLDDHTRLSKDLARYFKTRDLTEMNRCFDCKFIDGKWHDAGQWIRIDRAEYIIPTLADFDIRELPEFVELEGGE